VYRWASRVGADGALEKIAVGLGRGGEAVGDPHTLCMGRGSACVVTKPLSNLIGLRQEEKTLMRGNPTFWLSLVYISPRDAFLPPTIPTSSILTSEKQRT
jgi:hypothetical protein